MNRLQNMGGEAEVNLLLSHRQAGQLFIIFFTSTQLPTVSPKVGTVNRSLGLKNMTNLIKLKTL